jgi:hypothetical protein
LSTFKKLPSEKNLSQFLHDEEDAEGEDQGDDADRVADLQKKQPQRKFKIKVGEEATLPGANVMITTLCNFHQFCAKNRIIFRKKYFIKS